MAENLPDTNVGNIEYISKRDAVDDLHTQLMYRMGSDDLKRRLDDWVKTLPSADVVQVVRCKDCRHWQRGMIGMGCYWDADYPHEENDFCSRGERKE